MEKVYFEQVNLCPKQARYPLSKEHHITLMSELGEFQLFDFSLDGFGVVASFLVGNKSPLTVTIETPQQAMSERLQEKLLDKIEVEVRWSRRRENQFFHGLKISALTEEQRSYIFMQLSNFYQNDNDLYSREAS